MWRTLLILVVLPFLAACHQPSTDNRKNTVTVSILPEKFFVEKIAGNLLEVHVMIPPGASPVTWEPTPADMNSLGRSQLYFRIGRIVFEDVWMKKIADLNPGLKIRDLSTGVDFITSGHSHDHGNKEYGNVDPHIWMSPANARIIAKNILHYLSESYPGDSSVFRKNYEKLLPGINAVDSAYRAHANTLDGMSFLIYHPALTYLARDYNMHQVVLEYEGKEPPPAHIQDIIRRATEEHITKIFVQKQFNMDNARSLASEIDGTIILIDPLSEDWESEMYHILDNLVN